MKKGGCERWGWFLVVALAAACGTSKHSGSMSGGSSSMAPGDGVNIEPSVNAAGPEDDGVECTLDQCSNGTCSHVPRHFMCSNYQYCDGARGCADGPPCLYPWECPFSNDCVKSECDAVFGRCLFESVDTDGDGFASVECGGEDCNEHVKTIGAPMPEVCDGRDNDCDGIIDPPGVDGCQAGETCVLGECQCSDATAACEDGGRCVDMQTDSSHCGDCATVCSPDETCSAGSCLCQSGEHCGTACLDLQTNPLNCAECGHACGSGAECAAAECYCPAQTVNCSLTEVLDCRQFQVDPTNCGGCGHRCLTASLCNDDAECESDVELVKAFGAAGGTPYSAPLAVDENGNVYVGLNAAGEHRLLPVGQASLWDGRFAIGKFDANLDLTWAIPSTAQITSVETSGDDVWIAMIATDTDITLGTTTFARAQNHRSVTIVAKLSGTNGAILEQHQFDAVEESGITALLVGSDGVWFSEYATGGSVDYLGTTSTPPGPAYTSVLYRLDTAAPRWLPGSILNLSFDDNAKIVAGVAAPGSDSTFSFGGDTFTTAKNDTLGVARYTKTLVHEASFLMPPPEYGLGAQAILPLGSSVLFVGPPAAFFETRDFTGALTQSSGPQKFPFYIVSSKLADEKLRLIGDTAAAKSTFLGRNFAADNKSLFMSFDLVSGELDSAFTIDADAAGGAYAPGISDFAVDSSGSSLLLSVLFDGAFQLGDTTYGAAGKQGIALVKLKLRQP